MACQPPQPPTNEQTQSGEKVLTTSDLPILNNFLCRAARKCYQIGLQLGVKHDEIRNIEQNFQNNCERQLSQILNDRFKQDSPLTWPNIIVALRSDSVREYSIADEIETTFVKPSNLQSCTSLSVVHSVEPAIPQTSAASLYPGNHIQPHQTPSPHANPLQCMQFDRFVKYVKAIYQSSVVQTDPKVTKWPITPTKEFINLVSIDRKTLVNKEEADDVTRAMVLHGDVDVIIKKKKPIDFEDVVKDLPEMGQKRVIVVEGAPGVGKSTFAWEFCRRWERGEIAQQFLLVLLLRLRDKRISEAKSLNQLLYHPLKTTVEAVEQELVDTHGARALFILEGYDELPHTCRSESSFLVQIISGELLPKATVLVTSRPWATRGLHYDYEHRIFRYIEILGFSSSQITAYIESTVSEELVEDFLDYLIKHPQMKSCMYIPLNSAIVVKVHEESIAGRCSLPKTSTELYTALAIILLLRHMHGKEKYRNMTAISSFNELPQEVYEQFLQICEVAYDGIATNDREIKIMFNDLPLHFENLGFMDSVTELYMTKGEITSHNFLHLTIQEYLAAVHISKMAPYKCLQHFKKHEDGRYKVVLRFLAGITKFNGISVNTIQNLIEEYDEYQNHCKPYAVQNSVVVQESFITWMFEAQSWDLISELLDGTVLYFEKYAALPLDYYSLGYCIVHSSSQWMLALHGQKSEEDMRMLVAGATTRKETAARVVGLAGTSHSLTGDYSFDCSPLDISTNGLDILFANMQRVLCLKELWLELQTDCSSIAWPDLSQLQVLHLGIHQELSLVTLSTLLCMQLLESLIIKNKNYRLSSLNMKGYMDLANLLSSNALTNVDISDHEYQITKSKPKTLKKVINSRSQTSRVVQMSLHTLSGNESLGYIIAHSSCQWILQLYSGYGKDVESTESEEEMIRFVTAANSNKDTCAQIVNLRGRNDDSPLIVSVNTLHLLFKVMKHMLSLEELSLQLPVDCSCIAWPDLSRLRVLHLGISGERKWKLSSLLPHLTLDTLKIEATYKSVLCLEDCIAIGELLSPPKCPNNVYIKVPDSYCVRTNIKEGNVPFNKKPSSSPLIEMVVYNCLSGYNIIAYSNSQWILTFDNGFQGKVNSDNIITEATSRMNTSARIMGLRSGSYYYENEDYEFYLRPLSISANSLNGLFKDMKHILSLEELSLELPVDCSCIAWPDLSRLRVLHLGIGGERNWKLSSLLSRLKLDTLKITCTPSKSGLCQEDFVALGQFLSLSTYPSNVHIEVSGEFNKFSTTSHVQVIKQSLNKNLNVSQFIVEMRIFDDQFQDYLGYFIAHSNYHWIVTFDNENKIDFQTLAAGASSRLDTSARVVCLRGGEHVKEYKEQTFVCQPLSISAEKLNILFTDMKHVLSLEELSLELPVDCSCIAWPDLSRLRVLHLGISSGERNSKLSSLLPHLTLDSLKVTGTYLCLDDSITIGELLSPSKCPKNIYIDIKKRYYITNNISCGPKAIGKSLVFAKKESNALLVEVKLLYIDSEDYLGSCIAHSSCHWILTIDCKRRNIKTFHAVRFKPETVAKVVGLRGGKYSEYFEERKCNEYFVEHHYYLQNLSLSSEGLNGLFKDMRHMLNLEELSLELPVDCSCIAWPDLSRLRVLHLGISGERNWKLSSLLPHLKLDTLTVTSIVSSECVLCLDDCIAIGEILSPSSCPKDLCVAINDKYKITSLQLQESTSIDTNSQSVEMVLFDNENQDYLGYCIAHSSCQWILTLSLTEEQNLKDLATGIMSRPDTSARVVGLRGGKYESPTKEGEMGSDYNEEKEENVHPLLASAEALNSLFTDVKHMMKLEELSLRLPVDCSHVVWPDLSGLKELHLQISSQQNWKLDTILSNYYSSLRCFRIDSATNDTQLLYEDCVVIANHLSSSNCLEHLYFGYTENSSPLVIQSITPIIQAMATNQSLTLLDLNCKCKYSFTDVKDLAAFIEKSTALQHLRIGWCVFDIRDFLYLSRLVYHGSPLQEAEKSFNNISLNVDGNEEIQLFTQLLADYPEALSLNTVSFSRVHDGGVKEVASALVQRYDLIHKTHSSDFSVVDTLNWWDSSSSDDEACSLVKELNHNASPRALNLSSNCISNDGIAALVPALCHDISSLEQLNLSNNRISDDGVAIIAESLHHCWSLSVLDLSSNNITDVGTVAIAKRLHLATKLRKLDLSDNSVSNEGTTALAQAFNHTTELKVLNLSANTAVGRRGMNKLVQALSIKKSLAYDIILPWQCKIYSDDCSKVKQCITFESESNYKDKYKVRERIERGRSKKRKRSSERTGRNRKMSTEMRRSIERNTERWRSPGRRGRERFSSNRDRSTEGNCTGRRRERRSSEERRKWWASEEKRRKRWPSEERRRERCPNEAIRDRQRWPSEERKKERWPSEERRDRERQQSEATRDRERWPSKESRRERWKSTASRDRERWQSEARRDRERWPSASEATRDRERWPSKESRRERWKSTASRDRERWQSEARRDRERWPSASEERRDRERWQSEVRRKRWRSKERSRERWQTQERGRERWRSTEIGKERRSARKMQWNSSTERSRERGQSTKRRKERRSSERSTQRKDSTGKKRKRSMERSSEEYIKRKSSTARNKKRESSTARKKEKSAERRSRERERRTPVHEKGGQCGENGEMEREKRSRARH